LPRLGLNETRIVEEAERIADQVGLARLTLAAVAESLGVRQPSLYKHVEGMNGLRRAISIRAKDELAATIGRAAVGRARAEAIESMSHAYREWALNHPGRYAAAQSAPTTGDAEDETASHGVVEVVSDVLAGYELRDDDAIDATRALRATLHGFVTLEVDGGFGLPVDIDHSFDQMIQAFASSLSTWDKRIGAKPRPTRRGG
jgi:AcrR family transcriptional regulator